MLGTMRVHASSDRSCPSAEDGPHLSHELAAPFWTQCSGCLSALAGAATADSDPSHAVSPLSALASLSGTKPALREQASLCLSFKTNVSLKCITSSSDGAIAVLVISA